MASLTPALELTPGTYSTRERAHPAGSGLEAADAWKEYWTESLRDSGIVGLAALPVGYGLVATRDLTEPNVLRTILAKLLEGVTEWALDEVSASVGGYVLQHGDAIIPPGCCGDLSNLRDWSEAAAHTSEEWSMVWIGHPWTHVRAEQNLLCFAMPNEQSPAVDVRECLRISRGELVDAIEVARAERSAFGSRLLPLIEELAPSISAQRVVDVLLLGHSE